MVREEIQAYLRGSVGSVPDHRHKARVAIKRVVIFLPVQGLPSIGKKNTAYVKHNTAKLNKTRYGYNV